MAKIRELSALIHGKYDTEAEFARALGWPRQRLNKITTGTKEPDLHETAAIAAKLEISLESAARIFLHAKSPNEQQTA